MNVAETKSWRPSRRMLSFGLAILFSLVWVGIAWASGGGGEGAEAGTKDHDHWSVFALVPGLSHNLEHLLGRTWLNGDPVGRVIHIVMALLSCGMAIGLAFAAAKRLRKPEAAVVPETKMTPYTFFEIIVNAIIGQMESMMGREKALATFPIVGSLAIVILFSNCLGLVPGFLPPSDNLNMTLAMGLCVFVLTHYYGVKYNGFVPYFKHFFGPQQGLVWLPLMILMFGIELVSHLVRPLSLGLRLMGNMFGDHTVLGIFLGFHLLFVPLPVMVLGLLVCIVQTLVFVLLTMVYFAMAVEDVSHH